MHNAYFPAATGPRIHNGDPARKSISHLKLLMRMFAKINDKGHT